MSKPQIFVWEPTSANLATIAASQSAPIAGSMALNSSVPDLPRGPYIYKDVIRGVSLTSASSNPGVTFTITGIGLTSTGIGTITETISAPSTPGTAYGTNNYQQISSITSNAAFTGVSAGFGRTGQTNFLLMDYNRKIWNATCSAEVYDRVSIVYTASSNLRTVEYPAPEGNLIVNDLGKFFPFPISTSMVQCTSSQMASINNPVSTVWFSVLSALGSSPNEKIIFTVLQQGIN